jgi:hypothetical protein
MAKVIGQDIPSSLYDTYHRGLVHTYSLNSSGSAGIVKSKELEFPWWYKKYKFPSPAQLYVRAIFKATTVCWHMQPDIGGYVRPPTGPIPKEWWQLEAYRSRTFGYRKFMSDTLIYKFRIGQPTWCVPVVMNFAWNEYQQPDTAFWETLYMTTTRFHGFVDPNFRNIMIERPPEDAGKQYLYLLAYETRMDNDQPTYVLATYGEITSFFPEEFTYNLHPYQPYHFSMLTVVGPGWYRFYVGNLNLIGIEIYHDRVWVPQISPQGSISFHSPLWGIVEERPFFSND